LEKIALLFEALFVPLLENLPSGASCPVAPGFGFLSILQALTSLLTVDPERIGFASLVALACKRCLQ
jgi:hypothetical protein